MSSIARSNPSTTASPAAPPRSHSRKARASAGVERRRSRQEIALVLLGAPVRLGLFLALCGIVASPVATAQNALGGGTVLDNNLSTTGGRINRPNQPFLLNRINNAIVTGNVGGGRQFRGDVGYSAEFDFRGSLGSDDTFRFRADSWTSSLPLQGYSQSSLVQSPYTGAGLTGGAITSIDYGVLSRSGSGADLAGLARFRYGATNSFSGLGPGGAGFGFTPESSLGSIRAVRQATEARDQLDAFPGLYPNRASQPVGWSDYLDAPAATSPWSRMRSGGTLGATTLVNPGAWGDLTETADRSSAWRDERAGAGPGGVAPGGQDAAAGAAAGDADARALGLTRLRTIEETIDDVPFGVGFDARLRAAGLTGEAVQTDDEAARPSGRGEGQPTRGVRGTDERRERQRPSPGPEGREGDETGGGTGADAGDPRSSLRIERGADRYLDLLASQIARQREGIELPGPGEPYSPELIAVIREYHGAIIGGRQGELPGLPDVGASATENAPPDPAVSLPSDRASEGTEDEPLIPTPRTILEAGGEGSAEDVPADEDTAAPRSGPAHGLDALMPTRVEVLAGETGSRFDAWMRSGEQAMADRRYFDAEAAFEQALESAPDHPMALVGLAHARLGAGVYRSAGRALFGLLRRHPELATVEYDSRLTPDVQRLRQVTPSILLPLLERPDWPEAGLLLAYTGRLVGERRWIELGLTDLRADLGAEDGMLEFVSTLERAWLEGAAASGADDAGG